MLISHTLFLLEVVLKSLMIFFKLTVFSFISKADSQAEQLERVREKYQEKHDNVRQLQAKLEVVER